MLNRFLNSRHDYFQNFHGSLIIRLKNKYRSKIDKGLESNNCFCFFFISASIFWNFICFSFDLSFDLLFEHFATISWFVIIIIAKWFLLWWSAAFWSKISMSYIYYSIWFSFTWKGNSNWTWRNPICLHIECINQDCEQSGSIHILISKVSGSNP